LSYGEVRGRWDDRPVAIVGCGPSLAGFDHRQLNGGYCYVLAVASALWQMPWCDAVYDQDSMWLRVHEERLRSVIGPELYLCWPPSQSLKDRPNISNAIWLEGQRGDGSFAERKDRVEVGFTSGQAALNVAYHKGARRIVLFGYDYYERGKLQHARNEEYPWHLPPGMLDQQWPQWARKFNATRKHCDRVGITVFNASPASAITAFDRGPIIEGLKMLQQPMEIA
jgi:hypothetical protein